jgi:hypothetical protein
MREIEISFETGMTECQFQGQDMGNMKEVVP